MTIQLISLKLDSTSEIEIYVEANGESISLDVIGKGSVIG